MGSKWGLDTQNYGKVLQLTNLFFDYNHSAVKRIYCITLHHNTFSCLFFIITFLCFMFLIFLISLSFYSFKMFLTLILLFACKLFSVCFHFIVFVLVRDLIVCSLGSSAGFVFWRSSVYPSRSTHHLFPPCLVSFKTDLKQLRQVPLPSGFWKESSGEWWEGEREVKGIYSLTSLPIVLSVSLTDDWNLDCLLLILISLTSFQVCY